jgi:hypothetical protein
MFLERRLLDGTRGLGTEYCIYGLRPPILSMEPARFQKQGAAVEGMPAGDSLLGVRDRAILKFYLYTSARIETGCQLNIADFIMELGSALPAISKLIQPLLQVRSRRPILQRPLQFAMKALHLALCLRMANPPPVQRDPLLHQPQR